MKKKITMVLAMVLFALGGTFAQEKIVEKPDVMPEYPGGMTEMVNYMSTNLEYPKRAEKAKIEGTVYVEFVIDKSGDVRSVNLAKGVDSDLDTEALRVVQSMPDWKPGIVEGEKVSVKMVIPVKFSLN